MPTGGGLQPASADALSGGNGLSLYFYQVNEGSNYHKTFFIFPHKTMNRLFFSGWWIYVRDNQQITFCAVPDRPQAFCHPRNHTTDSTGVCDLKHETFAYPIR